MKINPSKLQSNGAFSCRYCKHQFPRIFKKSFNVCPFCGKMFPEKLEVIINAFHIMQVSKSLSAALRLVQGNELVAAARESLIVLESAVKKLSGLHDLGGVKLMAQAFGFEYDDKNGKITSSPLIPVNRLLTRTERNEQDGIRLLAMGLMRGIRNIYLHSNMVSTLHYPFTVIAAVDLILKQLPGSGRPVTHYIENES